MRTFSVALLSLVAALTACAGLNVVESEVSTYSQWPTGRKPGTYTFERLPSQQARAQEQAELEAVTRPALAAAGFTETNDAKGADVTVQVGARISRTDRAPYDDPFWWRGGMYYSRFGRPLWGPGFGMSFDSPRYDREVALLIRDRQSNQPLYEARASNDGLTAGGAQLMGAMFQAATKDFPHNGINPRRVAIQLPK
ncbi:MAG: DUF4136 domain-containing protein [Cytophagales bacterium]|nr:DUF4136 domain-containing protein [Rhizobacter sp.]